MSRSRRALEEMARSRKFFAAGPKWLDDAAGGVRKVRVFPIQMLKQRLPKADKPEHVVDIK